MNKYYSHVIFKESLATSTVLCWFKKLFLAIWNIIPRHHSTMTNRRQLWRLIQKQTQALGVWFNPYSWKASNTNLNALIWILISSLVWHLLQFIWVFFLGYVHNVNERSFLYYNQKCGFLWASNFASLPTFPKPNLHLHIILLFGDGV